MSRGGQRHQSTRQAPTPCGCERSAAWNDPDLSQLPVSTAVEPAIASADMVCLSVNTIVVEKSTLPVRTASVIQTILGAAQGETPAGVPAERILRTNLWSRVHAGVSPGRAKARIGSADSPGWWDLFKSASDLATSARDRGYTDHKPPTHSVVALNIRNAEANRLAAEVASLAGETKTLAVIVAIKERRQRLQQHAQAASRVQASLVQQLDQIGVRCASRAIRDSRSPEAILGYDATGLPS